MLIYVYWILSKQKKEKTNEAKKNEHLIKVNKVKKNIIVMIGADTQHKKLKPDI